VEERHLVLTAFHAFAITLGHMHAKRGRAIDDGKSVLLDLGALDDLQGYGQRPQVARRIGVGILATARHERVRALGRRLVDADASVDGDVGQTLAIR